MITLDKAKTAALGVMPRGSKLIKTVDYENRYIFLIHWPDELEGHLDPFFYMDKETGEFGDFDVSTGGPDLIRQFT